MVDLEIKFDDREKEIREGLEKSRLEAEANQKSLLKDRQTQEKLIMFEEILKKMDESDPMKAYLLKEQNLAEKELRDYEKKIKKDHLKKVEEMEKEKEAKLKELLDRQERMFSWEDKVKKDEQKMMLRLAEQKKGVMSKKLEE